MPIFDLSNLIGRPFSDGSNDWRMPPSQNDNGEHHQAKLLEVIVEDKEQPAMHPDHVKFCCSVNDDCRWHGTDAAWPGDHYLPPIRTPGNWEC